jgi:hypothetical protein
MKGIRQAHVQEEEKKKSNVCNMRYQTDPLEHRDPSPWRDTYVQPPPKRLWQPWHDWSPYACWCYGYATPEDDHLRLIDPDMFWNLA